MKKVVNKKGYKKTKIGWIPEEWGISKVGDICDIKGRIGYRGYTVNDIVDHGEGAITISPSNIKNAILSLDKCTYISWFKYEESPEIQVQLGDILLVKTGSTFGKTALVKQLPYKATINPQLIIIKNVSELNIYLSYLIASKLVQRQIVSTVVGGAIPTLSQKSISSFHIPLPPLPEQKKIAQILTTWDTAIQKTEALLSQLRLRKQGLMQRLLSGEQRLKGFVGEWEEVKLGDIGEFLKGKGIPKKELTESGIPCVRYGELYTKHHYIIYEFGSYTSMEAARNSKKLEKGDILFSGSGEKLEEIGKCAAFNFEDEAYAGGDIIILRNHNCDCLFLGYALNQESSNRQKYALGQGHSVVHIYASGLKTLKIKIPGVEEQAAIAVVLTQADLEIHKTEAYLSKLQTQKKGLMQQLLTGQRRVKLN